ncbi:MAG: prepilin-type N-terminal cleavage/methylation domain-containing protein [Syntrophaceae bacterium]|nr:prepilin-type N-terminal cleavage/methylation domain-containing protein [Syntrophaceae bacterium]
MFIVINHMPVMKLLRRDVTKGKTARGAQLGYTLLELLIAMSLMVVIVGIMGGALALSYRSVEKSEVNIEKQERFRSAFSIMDAQIQSQLPITYDESGTKMIYFQGDAKNLQMATNYSIWGSGQGYVIVAYKIEDEMSGEQTLYAYEQTPGFDDTRKTALFKDATEISFAYLNPGVDDKPPDWLDEWRSTDLSLPTGVGLHIRYGTNKHFALFPTRSVMDKTLTPMTLYRTGKTGN